MRTAGISTIVRSACCFLLSVASGVALSAEHGKQPAAAATLAAPTSQSPLDVNVLSMPSAPPPQVTVNVPQDDSTRGLVHGTWALVIATALTALVAAGIGIAQSRETRRRDRAALMRELNRVAQGVMTEAERVKQIARTLPTVRNEVHILAGQHGTPAPIAQKMQADLIERQTALDRMIQEAGAIAETLPTKPDKTLESELWRVDGMQARLHAMRDQITEELAGYQTENARLRDHRNELQAASVVGRMSQPLKTKLGE